jgi:hypothetical protein
MKLMIVHYRLLARAIAWVGVLAIIVLSVVPANDRPVTGFGPQLEHIAIFSVVAAAFAIGYEFSATRLGFLAFVFCGGIELLQVPLSTRHARLTDFVIDFVASCFGIGLVFFWKKTFGRQTQNEFGGSQRAINDN